MQIVLAAAGEHEFGEEPGKAAEGVLIFGVAGKILAREVEHDRPRRVILRVEHQVEPGVCNFQSRLYISPQVFSDRHREDILAGGADLHFCVLFHFNGLHTRAAAVGDQNTVPGEEDQVSKREHPIGLFA